MKVRMRAQISGTRNGAEWPAPGGVIDLPPEEAASLCVMGLAETAKGDVEVSEPVPAEKATTKRRKG